MAMLRIAASALLFLFCFCGNAVSSSGPRAKAEIRIGIIPEQNIFKQHHHYRAFGDYISRKTGITVGIATLSDYGSILGAMKSGEINAGFMGALVGAIAHERLGAEAIAMPVTLEGKTTYRGYLFARKDSGIRNIRDMRGKKMALVSRGSFSGYVYPLAYFRQHKIHDISAYFREYYFAGSYDASISAVLNGMADIGCAGSKIYNSMKAADPRIASELVIIDESMDVPYYGFFVSQSVSHSAKTALTKVLVEMKNDAEGAAILKQLDLKGFDAATSHMDYSNVFTTAEKAGINLKTYRLDK